METAEEQGRRTEEKGRRDDYKQNKGILMWFTKHGIDIKKLRISCIKGNAHIKGELAFDAGSQAKYEGADAQSQLLKKLEYGLASVPGIRSVRMDLAGWHKSGKSWSQK